MKIKMTGSSSNRLGRKISPKKFKAWLLETASTISDGKVHSLKYGTTTLDIWVCGDTIVVQ